MITIGLECESIETDSWGISRTTTELLKELSSRDMELKNEFRFVLYFKKRAGGPDSKLFKKRVAHISSFSLYYYLWLPWATRRDKLDLMFFPNYMMPYGMSCKTLVTLTEDIHEAMRSDWLPWRYKLAYKIFANNAARSATMINVYSRTSAHEVSRRFGISPDRIFINHLGVSVPEAINYKLKTKNYPYILYVGQMFPRRHAKETILACKKLSVKLIMVGIDKYKPKLSFDGVEHYDRVSDEKLEELYKNARLFVYVSDTEAFGLPPLEALARGVRPVVADTSISHELFGDDAIYTRPSVEAIANAVRRGFASTRPAPVNKFSWQKHVNRFLELCRRQSA